MQQELQGLHGMKELEKHFERLGVWSLFATIAATRDEKQLSGFVFIWGLWCNCLLTEVVVFAGFSVHVAIMFC